MFSHFGMRNLKGMIVLSDRQDIENTHEVSQEFNIQEELRKLPHKPGVYIMKDENDTIIYVGKAVHLKNRVRQYFQQSSAAQNPKVYNMARVIRSFEYIVTDNEVEALVLECNLIKKHRPKYNVQLKDGRTYPYLKVTTQERFPRVLISRQHVKDRAKYFGPFTSYSALVELNDVIHEIWRIRRCEKNLSEKNLLRDFTEETGDSENTVGEAVSGNELSLENPNTRPCLHHHIGQCMAPCASEISEEEYRVMIDEILHFLHSGYENVVKKLEAEMSEASENMEFERAAVLRDKIDAVRRLERTQKINGNPDGEQDIIAFARVKDEAMMQIFFVRGGKMVGREHFLLNGVDEMEPGEIMGEFIKRFYGDTTYIPKEIILETDVSDRETLTRWLSGIKEQNVTLTVPQKGDKLKLVQMAAQNAQISLEQFGEQLKREQQKTTGALEEIRKALGLPHALERIEAYDISNIQGYESVGSMVAFESGKPKRSDYRKFKIKNVYGANDYASMEEVLTRRLLRYKKESGEAEQDVAAAENAKFLKLPDIIMIDGGKAQVHAAEKVLHEMGMVIPVCGMIKDDRHRTRGMVFENAEILMPYTSEGFKLLTRIQDEVHRFAVEYHRKLREKAQIRSVLDDIGGVGETRRKALLKHFGDVHHIRNAEVEELAAVESMNRKAAEAVYRFFKEEEGRE